MDDLRRKATAWGLEKLGALGFCRFVRIWVLLTWDLGLKCAGSKASRARPLQQDPSRQLPPESV